VVPQKVSGVDVSIAELVKNSSFADSLIIISGGVSLSALFAHGSSSGGGACSVRAAA
jgi:hypothetical protein